jgi:multidrug resistance efflux pump
LRSGSASANQNKHSQYTHKSERLIMTQWQRSFFFKGKELGYNRIRYNNPTERCVEIPIAFDFLANLQKRERILEVGNVLSYYENTLSESVGIFHRKIVDKFEEDLGVDNQDLMDLPPTEKYDAILSISTVEHIGQAVEPSGTYGERTEERDLEAPLKAIAKIYDLLDVGGTAFITVPFGTLTDGGWQIQFSGQYLSLLTKYGIPKEAISTHFLKLIDRHPVWEKAQMIWVEADGLEVSDAEYNYPLPYANAIGAIELTKVSNDFHLDLSVEPTTLFYHLPHDARRQTEQYKVQLHQTQAELEQSQAQLHQAQAELEQSQAQLHQMHQAQAELEQSQAQLYQTQAELEQSQAHLHQMHQTQAELEQSQAQLHQTQAELEQSQAQLYQAQAELEQSQTQLHQTQGELEQSQAQLHQTQGELEQSQAQLHQTQGELEQSQAQLHQTQGELEQHKTQLHQTQTELGQSQAQLRQTQGELEQSQAQLRQTQGELEEYRTQLRQTQAELGQFPARLHQTKAELEQSQTQLRQVRGELISLKSLTNKTTRELKQSQSLLYQTQEELQQSQFLLSKAQQESEQSQTARRQTQEELEQSQVQLHKIQQEWEQFQTQLQETQKEVERSRLQQAMQVTIDRTKEPSQMQYALLVWEAWYAYQSGDLTKMQKSLQESLKCTYLSPTATVNNWLENFGKLGSEQGKPLDTYSLTKSEEWKQLMRQLMAVKPLLLTQSKG